jgi:hypothetical protein
MLVYLRYNIPCCIFCGYLVYFSVLILCTKINLATLVFKGVSVQQNGLTAESGKVVIGLGREVGHGAHLRLRGRLESI